MTSSPEGKPALPRDDLPPPVFKKGILKLEDLSPGMELKGTVLNVVDFGAFIDIGLKDSGLVHISQISDQRIEKVKDALQPGQEVEARVIKIDAGERRIGLSIKAAKLPDEEFQIDESMLEGLRPGEDLVDLGSALDEAFGASAGEEWKPGQK